MEHCSSTPSSLCGFQVRLSALATPSNLPSRAVRDISRPPPHAACTPTLVTLGGVASTYVHMEPKAALLADVRDGVDGVEGPEDGGARCAVHEEGAAALRQVLGDQLLEVLGPHPPAAVHLHLAAVVGAQPQRGRRALHRVVALHRRR